MRARASCGECGRPVGRVPVETDFQPYEPAHWERIGVLGMTQTGKSSLVKRWASYLMERRRAVFAIDVLDEYSVKGRARAHCKLGPLQHRATGEQVIWAAKNRPDFLRQRGLTLSVVPSSPLVRGAALAKELREVLPYLLARGNCVLIFDECHAYGEALEDELVDVAALRAKEGVTPLYVAQMGAMVPPRVRGQWSTCISFQQTKEADLRALRYDFGEDFASGLDRLPPGHFCRAVTRYAGGAKADVHSSTKKGK